MNIPLIICSVILATTVTGALVLRNRMRGVTDTPVIAIRRQCAVVALLFLIVIGQVIAFLNADDTWSDPMRYMTPVLGGVGIGILVAFGPLHTLRTARTDSDTSTDKE